MTVSGYLNGLIFVSGLFLSATFGSIFIMFPSFAFLLIRKPSWFRLYNDLWGGFWLTFSGAMLVIVFKRLAATRGLIYTENEFLFGTKLVVKGDKVDAEKDCPLIIVNHRCRLDWMFYWMVALRTGRLHHEKIIMKRELKFVPGPGWCMQNLMYCFLKRRWEEDKSYLDRIVNYLIDLKYPLQFFLYPEGTDLCKESIERSNRYAQKNNLKQYEYVLHPRVKGFNYLVQKMRSNILNSVYDVTVGFPVNLCYGEKDLVCGNFPKEVHFFFKRYQLSDLPHDSDQLDKWCIDRWAEKEERLKKFYERGKFDEDSDVENAVTLKQEEHAKIVQIFSLVFWFSFILVSIYMCWSSLLCLCYAIVAVVVYSFYNARGGTDTMLLDYHEKNKKLH